jgi:bifunctional DNase/RNase
MRKIKLNVLGISYSQTQSGAYALVLSEEDGERRLPIIIGGFEAQSIVIKLENLNPPRPLTHDLFKSFADLLNVSMKEVFIHKLEEGVFYSQLVCTRDDKELLIDSRTSDAVALALRFECPVYITEEIMDKAGIIIKGDEADEMLGGKGARRMESSEDDSLASFSLAELDNMLQEAIESEDYEKAAAIRDEIGKREKK